MAALVTISAGALWFAAGPASAVTISLGGSTAGATVSVGNGPLEVGVNGPGTGIAVEAAPSGATVAADTPLTPPLHVAVATPKLPPALPISPLEPAPTPAPPANGPAVSPPIGVSAPTQTVTPVNPSSGSAPSAPKSAPDAASPSPEAGVSAATRAINSVRHHATDQSATVTGSITSSSDAGVLSAFRSTGARLMLWVALAALILAMRLFTGSATAKSLTTKAARAD